MHHICTQLVKLPFTRTLTATRCTSLRRSQKAVLCRRHSQRSLDASIPSLKEFMAANAPASPPVVRVDEYVHPAAIDATASAALPPQLGPRVYMETFGCQMNESDSEIVLSILQTQGYSRTASVDEADVILTNTCAIRENAEDKVWKRLDAFKALKGRQRAGRRPIVGVLGCMAERLKSKLLHADRAVDVVVGPDAYRDLPRLLGIVRGGDGTATAVNVQLSAEETYADVTPVREGAGMAQRRVTAYMSIMRGCNNMCSFCVVPFTRGRERSRDVGTIVDEAKALFESGVKEVTLLGQNVNSFHDAATPAAGRYAQQAYSTAPGFSNMFKSRDGDGVRFAELLDRLSATLPEMRIRFTSPHPKDFPLDLLQLMAERPNLCKHVHLPAQSGSTSVLTAMRRGYTREAYLDLAARMRAAIPGVALSSDFISGFCGETEDDHAATLSLMRHVQYEQAFMFAYSLRERTHAAYKLVDDVPETVKQRRLAEVIATFREQAAARAQQDEFDAGSGMGRMHLVLVEGQSKRSQKNGLGVQWTGRTDTNKRCHFMDTPVPASLDAAGSTAGVTVQLQPGDYVAVRVTEAGVTSLTAVPLARTSVTEFARASCGTVQQAAVWMSAAAASSTQMRGAASHAAQ